MAYSFPYSHDIFLHAKGIDMKECIVCGKQFEPFSSEKGCSIKCKLLADVRKENGCWFFKSSTSGPYSKIWWDKKWWSAHRASYEVFVGKIPHKMMVLHKCDNPKCINPDHLFIGTQKDNMKDKYRKGRSCSGEKNHLSKFTDIQVEEMKILRSEGFSYERLSRIFNCSITYLNLLFKNKIRKG